MVKKLPASAGEAKDKARSLGQKDPLEDGVATCSSILAWRIPRTEEPAGLQSVGSKNRTCRQRQDVQQGLDLAHPSDTGMILQEQRIAWEQALSSCGF